MKVFYVLAFMVLGVTAMARQDASISGTVVDHRGYPVEKATIYVLNMEVAAMTDETGKFAISGLPAGNYTIRITAIGFAALSKEVSTGLMNAQFQLTPAAQQLDEVLVSAQKKDEWLQRVPMSVSVLSSTQVTNFRLWNPEQLTAIVPNLNSANPGDGRNVTSIRGITTTSYDPAVVTYIDGVNQFGLDTYIPQLFDIERIEVLRGPQGTLYGRNAMGGVINIITRQPGNKPNGFAEVSLGNYGQQRYGAGMRTPVVHNKLFVGAAMMYEKFNGFYDNEYYNEDFDKQSSLNGNYYIKYLPAQRWSVLLNVKHQNNRNNGTFPLVQGVEEALKDPFVLNQNARTKMIDNTVNGSLSISHAGRGFNFSSQTSFQSNHRHYTEPIDGDFSPLDAVTIINNYGNDWNTVKVWTQELRVSSPVARSSQFSWTAGTYLFSQKNPVKQTTAFGSDADLIGAGDENFSIINTSRGKNRGIAFFGQFTFAITRKTEITAGLRYDNETRELAVKSEYQKDPIPDPIFDIVPDTSARASFSAFTPKLSIAHHFSADEQLYITYNRGYRAGGHTQLSSDPSQPPLYPYKPEYSNNFEAGYKNQFFGNKVRIHLSAFYSTVNDAQVPTLVLPDAITVTRNAGKLESKGVEAEASVVWLTGFESSWAFGFTDAEYKKLKVAAGGGEVDLAGNKQIYTPQFTSLLTAQYTAYFNERRMSGILFRVEWQHLGEQYFDLANTIRQKPFSLFNARVGFTSREFEVMGWARNMGNKKYIAYAYDFGAVHLGNPSVVGATVMYKF
jgi:iron complex outermembrane receptor protein